MIRARLRDAATTASLVLALLLCLAAGIPPAWAHASFVSSLPADGDFLLNSPDRLVLSFSEPVTLLDLSVVQPDGKTLTIDGATAAGSQVTAAVTSELMSGTHVLNWRVVSDDGHPVGGSIVFSIRTLTQRPDAAAPSGHPLTGACLWIGKLGVYLALLLGVGSAFYRAWLFRGEQAPRKTPVLFAVPSLLCLALLLAAQGFDALGRPVSAGMLADAFAAGARTSLGPAVAAGGIAIILAAVSMHSRTTTARALSMLALCGAGLFFTLTGHASTASPQLLMRPAVLFHTIAATLWVGALIPLARALQGEAREVTGPLKRFTAAIPWILTILLATGGTLAAVQLGSFQALWASSYGKVLLAKSGLVLLLLILGAYNRWRLTAPVLQGDGQSRRRLRTVITAEVIVVILVLGMVALWRFTPPPRSLIASHPQGVHLHGPHLMAQLTFASGEAGPQTVHVSLMDEHGARIDSQEVRVSFSMPSVGIEPIRRSARRESGKAWTIDDVVLPIPGRWTVEVRALVSDFESRKVSGEFTLR